MVVELQIIQVFVVNNPKEFVAASIETSLYQKRENLFLAFKLFDTDDSGKISSQELEKILGSDPSYQSRPMEFWKGIIKEADKNSDGEVFFHFQFQIDYNEFVELMLKAGK